MKTKQKWNECSPEEKQRRLDSALAEFAADDDSCPVCNGSGLDKSHRWPDGSLASCSICEGYGKLSYTPQEKERMWEENDRRLNEPYLATEKHVAPWRGVWSTYAGVGKAAQ